MAGGLSSVVYADLRVGRIHVTVSRDQVGGRYREPTRPIAADAGGDAGAKQGLTDGPTARRPFPD